MNTAAHFLSHLPDRGLTSPPLNLTRVWKALADPRFGVIRMLIESCRAPEFPQLHIAAAVLSNSAYFCMNDAPPVKVPNGGAGAGISREQCLWSTIGESVERYCGGVYHMNQLKYGMPGKMDADTFPIDEVILFAEDQYEHPDFPFGRLRDQTRLQWALGRDLMTGDPMYLPSQLVFFGLQAGPGEALTQTVSTGMACGADYKHAITSGFREVLERDVFMAMWLLRYQPQRLELDAAFVQQLPPAVQAMLASDLTEIKLWHLPNEFGAITILACVEGRYCYRIGHGASCHFSLLAACEKAIIEACHTWVWSTRFADSELENAQTIFDTWGKMAASKEHVSYYLRPENRHHIAFLLDQAPVCKASEMQRALPDTSFEQVVQNLHDSGRRIGWIDLTTNDVRDTGLRAVKVIISRTEPLYFGNPDCYASRDPRRLQELADFWKVPMPQSAAEFNPAPHPFP